MLVEKRFRALRIIGTLLKVLAVLVLVLGVLAGLIVLASGAITGATVPRGGGLAPVTGGVLGGVGVILAAIFYGLLLYASGDFIYLALDVEENTRAMAVALRDVRPSLAALGPTSLPESTPEAMPPSS